MAVSAVTNLPDFNRQLDQIALKLQRKVVRNAASAAAAVYRKMAAAEAPQSEKRHTLAGGRVVMPGYLKSNVFQYLGKAPKGSVVARVSVRSGRTARTMKSGRVRDAYYWRWVHEGHLPRQPGGRIKGGQRKKAFERKRLRGAGKWVPGNPFMTRAFSRAQKAALDRFNEQMDREFQKENIK